MNCSEQEAQGPSSQELLPLIGRTPTQFSYFLPKKYSDGDLGKNCLMVFCPVLRSSALSYLLSSPEPAVILEEFSWKFQYNLSRAVLTKRVKINSYWLHDEVFCLYQLQHFIELYLLKLLSIRKISRTSNSHKKTLVIICKSILIKKK